MEIKWLRITTIIFVVYLLILLFTDFSLTGFWTDLVFSILLSIFSLILRYNIRTDKTQVSTLLRVTNIVCCVAVFGFLGVTVLNPFASNTLKLRSFYFQSVSGRLFNAYFKPVGAYSGGFGNFWITESPKFLPIFEIEKYYDRTADYDFLDDNWDGKPINNDEVVREYISEEVIAKNK